MITELRIKKNKEKLFIDEIKAMLCSTAGRDRWPLAVQLRFLQEVTELPVESGC